MDKETLKLLLPFVNSDLYQSVVNYVDIRINLLYKDLESASIDRVPYIQGQIKELRSIQKLKEKVNSDLRNYKDG